LVVGLSSSDLLHQWMSMHHLCRSFIPLINAHFVIRGRFVVRSGIPSEAPTFDRSRIGEARGSCTSRRREPDRSLIGRSTRPIHTIRIKRGCSSMSSSVPSLETIGPVGPFNRKSTNIIFRRDRRGRLRVPAVVWSSLLPSLSVAEMLCCRNEGK